MNGLFYRANTRHDRSEIKECIFVLSSNILHCASSYLAFESATDHVTLLPGCTNSNAVVPSDVLRWHALNLECKFKNTTRETNSPIVDHTRVEQDTIRSSTETRRSDYCCRSNRSFQTARNSRKLRYRSYMPANRRRRYSTEVAFFYIVVARSTRVYKFLLACRRSSLVAASEPTSDRRRRVIRPPTNLPTYLAERPLADCARRISGRRRRHDVRSSPLGGAVSLESGVVAASPVLDARWSMNSGCREVDHR